MRVSSIMRAAMKLLSGGSATDRSRMISTAVPPAPKLMTGPNTVSRATPIISSRACGSVCMRSRVTPRMRASGRAARTVSTSSP